MQTNKASESGFHRLRPPSIDSSNQLVLFLDLDNTLYPSSTGIAEQMNTRIASFFTEKIGMTQAEAVELGRKYYKDYGLAVKGVLKHHIGIDPRDYEEWVDGGLDLQGLEHDEELKATLGKCTARMLVFTNAGLVHARRVLQQMHIEELFEGICYCDYAERRAENDDLCNASTTSIDDLFPAKPEPKAYERAMRRAGISAPSQCYFADDSAQNIEAAMQVGWNCVLVAEDKDTSMRREGKISPGRIAIRRLADLPLVFPKLFLPRR